MAIEAADTRAGRGCRFRRSERWRPGEQTVIDAGAMRGRNFAAERQDTSSSVFDAAVSHIGDLRKAGRKVLISAWTEGSLDRLLQVLTEHGLGNIETVSELRMVKALSRDKVTAAVLPIEDGFETSDLVVVTEQDILGDRLIRRSKRSKRNANVITEATGLGGGRYCRPCRSRHRPVYRPADDRSGRRAA